MTIERILEWGNDNPRKLFQIDGFGAILVNDGGAVTIDNANYAASNASSLTLNFSGDEITGTAISGLSITYDNSGSNAIKDRSSGTLEIGDNIVSLAYVDAAKPAILSAVTGDNNADGTVDRLTLTFSESVSITDGGTDNDITLTGSSGSPVITAGTYSLSNPTTLTYVIGSSTANNTSLTITPTYAVSGAGIIKDASNNEMANGETVSGTDGAGPAIIAAALEQPYMGWTDTISAAGGMTVLGSIGVVRHSWIAKTNPFDVIPVDIVSNGILVATAYHGGDEKSEKFQVYHCSTTSQNPLTAEGYKDEGIKGTLYTQINGQVIRPMRLPHYRTDLEFRANKFIWQDLPLHMLDAGTSLPIAGLAPINKQVKKLKTNIL